MRPITLRIDDSRWARAAVAAAASLLALFIGFSGLGQALDRAIDPLRFALVSKPASGDVIVVELDAASAAAIKRWPWPRDHYARAVDRLREAGAAAIVFDVDFSSPSTADGDAAFAAALSRSGGLVALPTFAQQARSGEQRSIDSLPLAAFRPHVALASVSIAPDSDGTVRSAPFATITQGVPRPSLSAYTAARSGSADAFFPIDFGIDPSSIPRLSFVAVRDGRFDPAAVRGKHVLVGATAIEMGDRYATPRWGVLPGVIVQALAAETLIAGVPVRLDAGLAFIAALLLAFPILRARSTRMFAALSVLLPAALFCGAVLLQLAWQAMLPLGTALVLLAAVILGRLGLRIGRGFEEQRLADLLTGLPNRRAMVKAGAPGQLAPIALLQINNLESLVAVLGGDGERDLVLRLAERARFFARDGQVYRVADRLLALHLIPDGDSPESIASLRAMLLQPVEVLGRRVDAAITLGLADGDIEGGLHRAALAAERAAAEGSFWRQAEDDRAALEEQVSLMGELDLAIARGEIRVFYQPKLLLGPDRITSCEALVRWEHPSRGMIGPGHFIPLAEQTDRIAPLTLCVIEQVLHDLARWRQHGFDITAAVNISARLVASDAFNDQLCALLAQEIAPSTALAFEVTESATLADPDAAAATLAGYRQLGITISIDDYGTGQSTLSYLRQLPLSELKIDRSFVENAHANASDAVLVRSTVQMAHELGLKVVAEGVETEACLAFLRGIGCDMAQGYLISRPVPADALENLLAANLQQVA
jgi:EAL domain-containing protein (putative c-di-GMP-specific phosphodiesterase class I)/CHASE2 domain-containing sensor protein